MGLPHHPQPGYNIAEGLRRADNVARAPGGYNPQKIAMNLNSIHVAGLRERTLNAIRTFNIYVKLSVDDEEPWKSTIQSDTLSPSWDFKNPIAISVHPSSLLRFTVWRDSLVKRHTPLAYYECRLVDLLCCQPNEPHQLISDDSPSSTMSIGVQVDTESFLPILEDLDEAAAKLNRHPGRESVAHLLNQALHILRAIMKVVKPVADMHFIAQGACVLLSAAHKSVGKFAETEHRIKDLVSELRDALDQVRQLHALKAVKGGDQHFREVAQLATEAAVLIDEWLRALIPARAMKASDIATKLDNCKTRLGEVKERIASLLKGSSLCPCSGNSIDVEGLHEPSCSESAIPMRQISN